MSLLFAGDGFHVLVLQRASGLLVNHINEQLLLIYTPPSSHIIMYVFQCWNPCRSKHIIITNKMCCELCQTFTTLIFFGLQQMRMHIWKTLARYGSLIDNYAKIGDKTKAQQAFDDMVRCGWDADNVLTSTSTESRRGFGLEALVERHDVMIISNNQMHISDICIINYTKINDRIIIQQLSV